MKFSSHHPYVLRRGLVTGAAIFCLATEAPANPTGLTVAVGSAMPPIQQTGSELNITVGNNAVLNWQHFNIAAGETTIFKQPSAQSIVWNRINDPNPSQIFGNLEANGVVVLLNSSGFYFGPNSYVSAAGLVVSTAQYVPPENGGSGWQFNGPPPLASIVNYGRISVGQNGSAFLIADQIENHGTIEAPGGTIGLATGQSVLLSERPDGRGMSLQVKLPQGSVDNYGNLIADAGTIALNAKVINQEGLLQANSVRNQNGVIELVAADQLNLGANSIISANGDNSSSGNAGGTVTLKSENDFADDAGSKIILTGGAHGGNGGSVEISAPNVQSLNSSINARAQPGSTAGKLLLDPDYIILDSTGSDAVPANGTVLAGANPNNGSGTLDLNVNSAFANLAVSQIILQAAYDITLAGGTSWDLSGTIGNKLGGVTSGNLILESGRNIIFGDSSSISDANSWSVTLKAGVSFPSEVVQPGSGSIYLAGGQISGRPQTVGGSIQTTDGSITLAAGQDIQTGTGSLFDIDSGFSITIESSTGDINLNAGRDIQIGSSSVDTTGGSSITATAGQNIQMNGGSIATIGGGDITVTAEQDIQVGSGSITTINGGNITATATVGSVDTGTDSGGYVFNDVPSYLTDPIYQVASAVNQTPGTLGGISTTVSGNVKITAGLDIISLLPTGPYVSPLSWDAGSGAFGSGDVTLQAGRNVVGHYVLAEGKGSIKAGSIKPDGTIADGNAGTPQEELALSLINGNWNVQATHDINLQEVRNPNGIFNEQGTTRSKGYHLFDYAAGDSVALTAGNSVQLLGDSVPRNSDEAAIPIIYPPILDISAGAGGVVLGNNVILFSSPSGSLNITTTGGGVLESLAYANYLAGNTATPPSSEVQFIVSDSSGPNNNGRMKYAFNVDAFGISDHAAVPTHLNSPTEVALNISGDMDYVELISPEAAQINVVGNMNNSSLTAQNLHPADVTSINVGQAAKVSMETSGILNPATDSSLTVGGDILNASEFNSIPLASAPDLALLSQAYDPNTQLLTPLTDLASHLHYDPTTGLLTYQGKMNAIYEGDLSSLKIVDGYNLDGTPQTTTVHILSLAEASALYQASQNSPSHQNDGYSVGGGGQLNISARNVNLGSTHGIQSVGPNNNGALANYFTRGADINITLSGNLDMFSTSIASINGGNITVNAGVTPNYDKNNPNLLTGYDVINPDAEVNVGSTFFTGDNTYVRGIFTAGLGNVNVTASGNISLDGSRVAAYDGGNVTIISLNGNLDAGTGGSSAVAVNEVYVDPITHHIYNYSPTIPGSGVLATTFPPRSSLFPAPEYGVGNIRIETPNGNINASSGGILQLPLNGVGSSTASVTLRAGEDLENSAGTIIFAGSPGRDINASGSGVIGGAVNLKASGNINGLVIARGNAVINASQNLNVTAIAEGTVSANAGGTVSGTIIGVGGISASGSSIDASLLSNNSISGATTGQSGMAQGTAANATSAAASNDNSNQTADKTATGDDSDDLNKKKKPISLAQKVGRVTVLLPTKTN
jgi:filamentous hemagglutinin family protein